MRFIFIICTFCLSSFVQAEKIAQPSSPQPKQAIGLSLGWVVANGLSYRRYFGNQFIQGTFAGAVDKDEDREYVDASLSYGRYLNTFELTEGAFPFGLKFIAGIEAEHDNNRSIDIVSNDQIKSANELHTGAGFGLDFGNPNRNGLIFSLDIIYTASFRGFSEFEFVRLGLLPSVSIHYNM